MKTTFRVLERDGNSSELEASLANLVIAGWAGRDRAAVDEHIREMEEIGVPAPSSVPVFYRAGIDALLQTESLQVLGPDSSGEAEAVLIDTGDDILVAVGSDHTDRKLESYSIAASKQICAKPVSRAVWRFSDVEAHWDQLVLRSFARIDGERVLYQEGTLDGLLHPRELFGKFTGGGERLAAGTAMFGGTLAVHGGIRPAEAFEAELHDPKLGRSLKIAYEIEPLPIVS